MQPQTVQMLAASPCTPRYAGTSPLYQRHALRPLAWLVEHTNSTPATHFAHYAHYAHHALVQDDGIGHYTGNYGNLTDDHAHGPEPWRAQFVYPLWRSRAARPCSDREATRHPDSPAPGENPMVRRAPTSGFGRKLHTLIPPPLCANFIPRNRNSRP